jgi:hypothetical protein
MKHKAIVKKSKKKKTNINIEYEKLELKFEKIELKFDKIVFNFDLPKINFDKRGSQS